MKTETFTPGPWIAKSDNENNIFSAWSVYAPNELNGYICTTSGNCKANAELIASAPTLLKEREELFQNSTWYLSAKEGKEEISW